MQQNMCNKTFFSYIIISWVRKWSSICLDDSFVSSGIDRGHSVIIFSRQMKQSRKYIQTHSYDCFFGWENRKPGLNRDCQPKCSDMTTLAWWSQVSQASYMVAPISQRGQKTGGNHKGLLTQPQKPQNVPFTSCCQSSKSLRLAQIQVQRN